MNQKATKSFTQLLCTDTVVVGSDKKTQEDFTCETQTCTVCTPCNIVLSTDCRKIGLKRMVPISSAGLVEMDSSFSQVGFRAADGVSKIHIGSTAFHSIAALSHDGSTDHEAVDACRYFFQSSPQCMLPQKGCRSRLKLTAATSQHIAKKRQRRFS